MGRSGVVPTTRSGRNWFDRINFALLAIAGLVLAVPGAYLATLGGSLYYVVAGLFILVSAGLVLAGRAAGAWLFAAAFAATVVWALAEVGGDGWALMPRLAFFFVAVLWLFLTTAARRGRGEARPLLVGAAAAVAAMIAVVMIGAFARFGESPAAADTASAPLAAVAGNTDWPAYGGSLHATRYSPLDEIRPQNVASLIPAWTYRTGLTQPGGKRKGSLELTPLAVDGKVYGCTAFSSIFALDPVSGRQIWRYTPKMRATAGGHPVCRGVAFFRAPPGTAECPTRILLGTLDNHLIAVDAQTGAPCRSFGRDGAVDLLDGVGHFPQGWSHPTSPPTIVNGTAVMGAFVVDNQSTNVPPGVIRGYDAVTGAFRWAFDAGRPDDHRQPPPGQSYTPSTPNSWTVASGDDALNLVYVPMGNGSPDFFGGNRSSITDHFGAALVALDASTGVVRWSFQAVHHDLWDYDLAAQPVLVDLTRGGARVPALILPSKNGQIYLLDRRTGKPLSPVVERPVPLSLIAGERASPTQPASTGLPSFTGPELREVDMWGLTPFDQLYCRIKFRAAAYRGEYTPVELRPTIRYPGELGGIDWGSVSVDEGRGLLVVNSNRMADLDQLITRAQAAAEGLVPHSDPRGHFAPGGAMAGTPFGIHWGPFLSGLGVPCQRPPFGFLTAIDLASQRLVWQRPLGDARNSGPFGISLGLPIPLGSPNIGGTVTTGSGITFVAATQDEMFRAVDTRSGEVLWQTKLPAAGHATPMTYRGADGHQYVVIAAGGQALRDAPGDYLIAFRLKAPARN